MVYHVTCPFSGQKFYYKYMVDMRRFVYAMMSTRECNKRIRIYDGREIIGSMWKEGRYIRYQGKGTRKHNTVNEDGSLRK